MLKANDISDKPVVTNGSGRQQEQQIATIQDVIVNTLSRRLIGFLIRRGGWSGGARVLPWSQVIAVRYRSVLAHSVDSITAARAIPQIQETLEHDRRFRRSTVLTPKYGLLGTLTDIYFDSQTGEVSGYEVTDNQYDDLYAAGRTFVPAVDEPMIFDKDSLIVPQTAFDMMRKHNGSADNRRQEEVNVLGTRVRWDVRQTNGEIIAARGQIVNERILSRAEEQHLETALHQATG